MWYHQFLAFTPSPPGARTHSHVFPPPSSALPFDLAPPSALLSSPSAAERRSPGQAFCCVRSAQLRRTRNLPCPLFFLSHITSVWGGGGKNLSDSSDDSMLVLDGSGYCPPTCPVPPHVWARGPEPGKGSGEGWMAVSGEGSVLPSKRADVNGTWQCRPVS